MAIAQNELQMSATGYRTAWTAAPANYDILANDPLKQNVPGIATPSEGRPCRWIICGAVGTLVATGLDGVDVTLDVVVVGQRFDIQATGLKATSTAQKVSVYW